jgi:hypothetical protein
MSGGGGKGGSETTKTEVPDWIKQPAIRNLQRAEDVQRIEYMPYRGPEVAAFNATQNAAMDNNIATAKAFGLLDPNSTLTATTGMPTPTDFNGFSGYSSMPIYDQALADTKAAQPEAVALYDSLFGANAMAQLNASRNSGRSRGGSAPTARPSPARNFTPNYNDPHFKSKTHLDEINATGGGSSTSILDASYGGVKPTGTDYKSIVAGMKAQDNYEKAAGVGRFTPTPFRGNPHMGK